MTTTGLSWYHMIDVHFTLICTTQLTEATIALEHTFALLSVPTRVQFI
jgi:hypothetical protein